MLRIKFLRKGKKHQPFFNIVVIEKGRAPQSGKYIEKIGFYDPVNKDLDLKKERARYWLSKGAKPSETIYNLLIKKGVLRGKKIAVHKKSKKEKKEESKPKEESKTLEPEKKEGNKTEEESKTPEKEKTPEIEKNSSAS